MPIAEIQQLLRRTIGLDSASIGIASIERAVLQRMRITGLQGMEAYEEMLLSSTSELQELIECVVVPETWFFRDEEAFLALGRSVNGLLQDRPAGLLRILSVPCSTGEEPYSIVMALQDAGLLRTQISVDAVDISLRALAHARRGVYGRNSFRSQNLAFRERYFRPVSDGYAIAEWIPQLVSFHQGNLVSGQLPVAVAPYDLIYCRNLLIYFDRSTQERVMQTLHSLLSPDGILFVGPAEAFLAAGSGFTSVSGAASFAFRKSAKKPPPPIALPLARFPNQIPTKTLSTPHHRVERRNPPRAVQPAEPAADLATARRLADLGQLREAVECCERNVSLHGPSAEAYYLLGLARDAAHDNVRAAECYRRAIYLQPDHTEALTHLALFSEAQGDSATAQRLLRRAARAGAQPDQRKSVTP